ncbi:CCC motif membrane protein [Flavobacterium chuncheonense]|uniref:CCC motif membrane protein n=1 Tax=Flavobacterium chuncheonense TaxID=2026653 RepID=A0ABW5YLZ3_9FLAO
MNYKSKLSADPLALILGVIALTMLLMMFCCGFFYLVSLILSIVGLVAAIKSLKEYDSNREAYEAKSRENVYIGKILCLVSLVLNAIIGLVFLVVAFFVTKEVWSNDFKQIFKELEKNNKINTIDTISFDDYDDVYYEEFDTSENDSIEMSN